MSTAGTRAVRSGERVNSCIIGSMTNALVYCLLFSVVFLRSAPSADTPWPISGMASSPNSMVSASGALTQESAESNALSIRLAGEEGAVANLDCVTGPEFAKVIAWAESSKLSTLYLTIDSPGGSAVAKNEIVRELLGANARGMRTVAIVKRAEGTAALIALACSEVYVLPGAPLGSKELRPGVRNEIERKLLGEVLAQRLEEQERAAPVLAATDTEAANRFGRSVPLLRSMYEGRPVWLGSDGRLTDAAPADRDARPLFAERHAVSGGELVGWGFAKNAADATSAFRASDKIVPEKALATALRRIVDGRRRSIAAIESAIEDLEQLKRLGNSDTKSTQSSRDARRRKVEARLEEARADLLVAVTSG